MVDKVTREEWVSSFLSVYEQAQPIVEVLIKLDSDGQPTNPNNFIEAYDVLIPLYNSIKDIPAAPEKDLKKANNDFEHTLSMCIKAGEMMIKMIDDINHNSKTAARMHLASVVGYVNYASIYYKDCVNRLAKTGIFHSK